MNGLILFKIGILWHVYVRAVPRTYMTFNCTRGIVPASAVTSLRVPTIETHLSSIHCDVIHNCRPTCRSMMVHCVRITTLDAPMELDRTFVLLVFMIWHALEIKLYKIIYVGTNICGNGRSFACMVLRYGISKMLVRIHSKSEEPFLNFWFFWSLVI